MIGRKVKTDEWWDFYDMAITHRLIELSPDMEVRQPDGWMPIKCLLCGIIIPWTPESNDDFLSAYRHLEVEHTDEFTMMMLAGYS